jgi:hypothetical protein
MRPLLSDQSEFVFKNYTIAPWGIQYLKMEAPRAAGHCEVSAAALVWQSAFPTKKRIPTTVCALSRNDRRDALPHWNPGKSKMTSLQMEHSGVYYIVVSYVKAVNYGKDESKEVTK